MGSQRDHAAAAQRILIFIHRGRAPFFFPHRGMPSPVGGACPIHWSITMSLDTSCSRRRWHVVQGDLLEAAASPWR